MEDPDGCQRCCWLCLTCYECACECECPATDTSVETYGRNCQSGEITEDAGER